MTTENETIRLQIQRGTFTPMETPRWTQSLITINERAVLNCHKNNICTS